MRLACDMPVKCSLTSLQNQWDFMGYKNAMNLMLRARAIMDFMGCQNSYYGYESLVTISATSKAIGFVCLAVVVIDSIKQEYDI